MWHNQLSRCVHEKKACESLAENREPFKDKTNLCVQSDETARARKPQNKRRKSIENVEQLTTTDLNKKRKKEKEPTGRILLIAPHDDNINEETFMKMNTQCTLVYNSVDNAVSKRNVQVYTLKNAAAYKLTR